MEKNVQFYGSMLTVLVFLKKLCLLRLAVLR